MRKLRHRKVEKFAQLSGRAGWKDPEPVLFSTTAGYTDSLHMYVSLNLLTQNLLKGLDMQILILVSTPYSQPLEPEEM